MVTLQNMKPKKSTSAPVPQSDDEIVRSLEENFDDLITGKITPSQARKVNVAAGKAIAIRRKELKALKEAMKKRST